MSARSAPVRHCVDRLAAEHLVRDAGFVPVPTGRLAQSWRQQPGTPVYTADLGLTAGLDALAEARRGDTISWRQRMIDLARRGEGRQAAVRSRLGESNS